MKKTESVIAAIILFAIFSLILAIMFTNKNNLETTLRSFKMPMSHRMRDGTNSHIASVQNVMRLHQDGVLNGIHVGYK